MTDDEYIETIRKAREESVKYFSAEGKTERELWVAFEFLTNLGIPFVESDLVVPASDPPDILFRDIAFEIKEILDPGRRRHEEYKESLAKANAATKVEDLVEHYTPRDITYTEVCELVVTATTKLATRKYPETVRGQLDLLFYVNLEDVHGFIKAPLPPQDEVRNQGWRSVSFVLGNYSCVLMAHSIASTLLTQSVGVVIRRKNNDDPEHN